MFAPTWDVLSSVGDVDVIQTGAEGDVLHAAAAIFVVFAGHLGLGRAFHGDSNTADTCPSEKDGRLPVHFSGEGQSGRMANVTPCNDAEVVGLSAQGFLEPRPCCHHPSGVTSLRHGHPERAHGDRSVIVKDLDTVWTLKSPDTRSQTGQPFFPAEISGKT